jgi:hypothetical protein
MSEIQEGPPNEYPNVKARVRLLLATPPLPQRENYMDIWLKGTRFRVRDESGRDVSTIIGDLTSSHGLGSSPRSIEEMMDISSQSRITDTEPTELYGDLATKQGLVYSQGEDPWPIDAAKLAPAAEQIIAGDLDEQLEPRGEVIHLSRPSTRYHGVLEKDDDGIPSKREVTRIVSLPYLLFSNVRDSQDVDHYYTREVVTLNEGSVDDSDLTPP